MPEGDRAHPSDYGGDSRNHSQDRWRAGGQGDYAPARRPDHRRHRHGTRVRGSTSRTSTLTTGILSQFGHKVTPADLAGMKRLYKPRTPADIPPKQVPAHHRPPLS